MYLETSTVVWACETRQQNGIVWRKNVVTIHLLLRLNNLYFWSVLHRELLEKISKYRLKDTITNLLNIKHPSNKIIRAFDNSRLSLRNSKNILKCFDDRKNSRVHLLIASLGLELSLNRKKIKNDNNDTILLTLFHVAVVQKNPFSLTENSTSRNERAVWLLAIVFFAPCKCRLRLYIDGHLISPK